MYGGADNPIWYLNPTGYRLQHLAANASDHNTPLRIRQPSKRTIEHCLAVADARIAAEQTARHAGISIVLIATEPDNWRRYTGPMGTTEILKTDLEIVTRTTDDEGQYEDRWFMEIDLDTEHPPVVVRQCQQYEDYRRTGLEQERHGVFPIVVWVVPDEKRLEQLGKAIRAARRLDTGLFRVITGRQLPALIRSGEGDAL